METPLIFSFRSAPFQKNVCLSQPMNVPQLVVDLNSQEKSTKNIVSASMGLQGG